MPTEPGRAVQRAEHRHGRHGRAVRVGHDALGAASTIAAAFTSATTSGHVGVHAPGRRVVDDDRAGGGDLGGELARGGLAGGEQDDVEAGVVGGGRVLDGDLAAVPRQACGRPTGPRRRAAARRPGTPARRGPGASRHRPGRWLRRSRSSWLRGYRATAGRPQPIPGAATPGVQTERRVERDHRLVPAPPRRPRSRCGWPRWRSSRC